MRELSRTGYLSNRGRMLPANFLSSDLQVSYWFGAQVHPVYLLYSYNKYKSADIGGGVEHFENVCIDHDGCINWGYFKGCARSFGHYKSTNTRGRFNASNV